MKCFKCGTETGTAFGLCSNCIQKQDHTIVTVSDKGYSWKECKECLQFICSWCGAHCHSIAHLSQVVAVCPNCEETSKNRR